LTVISGSDTSAGTTGSSGCGSELSAAEGWTEAVMPAAL
jgi:hypothetical protein